MLLNDFSINKKHFEESVARLAADDDSSVHYSLRFR